MTPDQLAHVRADVQTAMVENRYDDPGLLPDLLDYLLTQISTVAAGEDVVTAYCPSCSGQYEASLWADYLLTQAQLRATSGIPFAERAPIASFATPIDPDWRDHP